MFSLCPWASGDVFRQIQRKDDVSDRILANEYEEFKKGDENFPTSEIQSKLVDLSFNQKSQNIAGMQIADLVAYPIGKWVMDSNRENPAFEIVKQKLHQKEGRFLGFGLKVFPLEGQKNAGPGKP